MFQIKKIYALVGAAFLLNASSWAQDYKCTSWEAFPEGASKAQEYHTIYRDDFKAKNWAAAYKNWMVIFPHVTSPKEAPKRHFEDGIKMCKELAKASTNADEKKTYAVQMIALYENLHKCVPATITAYELAYEAYDMQILDMDIFAVIKTYEKAISLDKNNAAPDFVYSNLTSLIVPMFGKDEKYNKEFMVNWYNQCKAVCESGAKLADAKKAEKFQKAWEFIQSVFATIEDKVFDCNYYKEKIEPEYNKLGDAITLEQVKDIYNKIKCPAEDVFVVKVKAKYQDLLNKRNEEKFDSIFNAGDAYTKYEMLNQRSKGSDNEESLKWLEKAFETNSFPADKTAKDKAKMAYTLAYKTYQNGSFSGARTWARRASDYNPNWGEPYLLVGTLYASSGKLCGPGTGWDSQVVVWAAMDEWNKAKSVDAGAADEANKMIGRYREFMPTVEEIFQRGLKEGASYKIGCWIGTTTTIRGKK